MLFSKRFLKDLRERRASLFEDVEVSRELVVGVPVVRILELATELSAAHIVMGCRGRTGVAHVLLGSKAARVVRLAEIPVTVVKAEEED